MVAVKQEKIFYIILIKKLIKQAEIWAEGNPNNRDLADKLIH